MCEIDREELMGEIYHFCEALREQYYTDEEDEVYFEDFLKIIYEELGADLRQLSRSSVILGEKEESGGTDCEVRA